MPARQLRPFRVSIGLAPRQRPGGAGGRCRYNARKRTIVLFCRGFLADPAAGKTRHMGGDNDNQGNLAV
ncbi:hypothetical protein CBM2592_A90506 [Cupriavidus taiwanensis]|nr:hypothetical protein CBM2592_A90506 [Cupriavidus taiwanensis]SOY79305.1 hypothetical protein CBM2591_A100197 [Cupriavidus taiwanensis]SOZ26180.1 hypothetical protein CBM2608_A70097 [Cupriavidus taiwanensis]SOZ80759.1 hypothetical protein CBM2621_A100082 [Cupriavidus taiwanensis]SPA09208.1 hypothetical protein CBM2631_A100197 [Cupriavidus taiwanensis]